MNKRLMEDLAQRQLEAYNQGRIEEFCACYHEEVKVWRELGDAPVCTSMAEFRATYAQRFSENPQLHCELKSRIVLGENVVDEEWVTGITNEPAGRHVVAIYGFCDGPIDRVWFAR